MMQKEVSELKRAIRSAPRNDRGRRRYGADLRNRVVDLAVRWRSKGHAVSKLARELGVRDSMLSEWLRKSASKRRVRSVEVVDEAPSSHVGLTMKLPSGARIEGLSLEDVVLLLRQTA